MRVMHFIMMVSMAKLSAQVVSLGPLNTWIWPELIKQALYLTGVHSNTETGLIDGTKQKGKMIGKE
jgi:hypothetical protein